MCHECVLLLFFFDFCSRKIGGGSDLSVKNVTLFFLMKASLIDSILIIIILEPEVPTLAGNVTILVNFSRGER